MRTYRHFRESPRLPHFDYAGNHVYNLGTATRGRRPFLTIAGAAEMCIRALTESCAKHRFETVAYCFMPDHVHLLVTGASDSSLEKFIKHFKQLTGWRFKQKIGEHLWQTSFYATSSASKRRSSRSLSISGRIR